MRTKKLCSYLLILVILYNSASISFCLAPISLNESGDAAVALLSDTINGLSPYVLDYDFRESALFEKDLEHIIKNIINKLGLIKDKKFIFGENEVEAFKNELIKDVTVKSYPVFVELLKLYINKEQLKKFPKLSVNDLIIISQRLHTFSVRMSHYSIRYEVLTHYSLRNIVDFTNISDYMRYKLLENVNMAGGKWGEIHPSALTGVNLINKSYGSIVEGFKKDRSLGKALPDIKAIALYFGIKPHSILYNKMRNAVNVLKIDNDGFLEKQSDEYLNNYISIGALSRFVDDMLIIVSVAERLKPIGVEFSEKGFLGRGFDGIVLRGVYNEQPVVIKINTPREDMAFVQLRNGINNINKIISISGSNNIVKNLAVFEFETDLEYPVMVEINEFVQGKKIYKYLAELNHSNNGFNRMIRILRQFLKVQLVYISRGYFDGDILNLSNLMVQEDGVLKAYDFAHIRPIKFEKYMVCKRRLISMMLKIMVRQHYADNETLLTSGSSIYVVNKLLENQYKDYSDVVVNIILYLMIESLKNDKEDMRDLIGKIVEVIDSYNAQAQQELADPRRKPVSSSL